MTPKHDPNYYRNPAQDFCRRLADARGVPTVLITGPTGCGKTTFVQEWADQYVRPLYTVDGGLINEAEQIFGQWQVIPGTQGSHTKFILSPFLSALEDPNSVILIDEINRFQEARAQNALFSLLDHRHAVYVQEVNRTFKVADGVVIFATLNEGAQYTSADALDLALRSRFTRNVHLTFPEVDVLQDILRHRTGADDETIVRVVTLVKTLSQTYPMGLRQAQACIEDMQLGANPHEAIAHAFGGLVPLQQLSTVTTMVYNQ